MNTNNLTKKSKTLIALLAFFTSAHAGTTQLSNSPLSGASSVEIHPNIMFILDDSLSMSWDYLPDWAGGKNNTNPLMTIPIALWQSRNSGFNGVAYNPAITYSPPIYYNSDGTLNTSTYPSQNAANTSNWTAVKRNPYLGSVTDNLIGSAYYYTTVPGEFCSNLSMRSCSTTTTSIPAKLRWCNSATEAVSLTPSAGACQATQINNDGAVDRFGYPRMPSPRTSTVSITAGGAVSSITVDGKQLLSAAVPSQADSATLISAIVDSINACTYAVIASPLGSYCQVGGYKAAAGTNTLTIYAPGVTTLTPAIASSPSLSASAFTRPSNNLAPGENVLTVITSSTSSYPKGTSRGDCAGASCTYDEEMTNYANWWAYYHTRMQSMKTAASRAFAPIDLNYRVGLMSIDNNTGTSSMGSSFLNVTTFNAAQKFAWYNKLFNAIPTGETPLRLALAQAGRIYAGKLTGSFNGQPAIVDPVQFSCQQNVSILSTDGYWNDAAGFKLDGATAVGDQDGPAITSPAVVVRPQLDGGAPIYAKTTEQITEIITPTVATQRQQKVDTIQSLQAPLQISTMTQAQSQESNLQATVSTLQTQTAPLQSQTSQLRTRTRQLQESLNNVVTISTLTAFESRTYQILKSTLASNIQSKTQALQYKKAVLNQQTKKLQVSTSNLQRSTSQLQMRTYPLQQRLTQVQQRTSSNSGTTWSAWSNVSTCIPVVNEKECKLLPISAWNGASTCTPVPQPGATNPEIKNPGTDSQYQLYTTVSECQYGSVTAWSDVSSCTPATKSSGTGTWSVGTAAECQYAAWTTPSNASTCTALARSSGTGTWAVGTATACSYTAFTAYADATGTCTTTPQSSGSGTWSTATAVQCQYTSWSGSSSTTSCTPQAVSGSSPYTVLTARACAYGSYDASWQTATAACTVKAMDSGTGTWTGPAMQCQYNPTVVGWNTGLSSCAKTSATDLANFAAVTAIVDCQTINVWSTPANAPSCTTNATTACTTTTPTAWAGPIASCTGGTSGTGVVTECRAAWTTPVAGACTPSATVTCGTTWGPWNNVTTCANNGTTSRCQYLAFSGYSNVNSPATCTIKLPSSGTGTWTGPVRDCSYNPATWTAAANDATCSPSPKSTGAADGTVYSVNVAKQCLYGSYTSWATATGTCTTAAQSTSAPYTATAVNCRYVDAAPSTVVSCTPSSKTASSPYTALTATACGYSAYGAWTDVASCSTVAQSAGAPYNPIARNCGVTWSPYTNTSSCTSAAGSTQCQYGSASWVKTPAGCTLLPASTGPNYTVGTATSNCSTTPVSGWTNTASCTEGADASNNAVSCQWVMKPATSSFKADCTEVADDGSLEHSGVTCPKATTGPVNTSTCTNAAATSANSYVKTICSETTEGPTSDTLADVAQYYYMSDLRDSSLGNCTGFGGNDVCANNVLPSGLSKANWQHMTTYTLGLGASGLMQYNKDYLSLSLTEGDFYSIKEGLTADTSTGVCPWQTRGACNWPKPISNTQTNIDDLWHAAVNGRGTYFSASDPESLAAGISGALASIGEKPGSLASVAVSNPNLTAGDNGFFEVQFKAGEWSGDVLKRTVNGTTGVLSSATAPVWSAQAKLDSKTTARNIYTFNSGGTDNIKTFTWSELTATEKDFFSKPNISPLSQFCTTGPACLSLATQTSAEGEPLVDFLRGDKSHEGPLDNLGTYYRQRAHLLGDIVGSEAVFVKGSPWNYADNGYSAFKTANTTTTATKRKGMVYIAANDGMLHAFDADTGEEDWAYVPAIVMPSLFRLADKNYPSLSPVMHRFNVDGTPIMGDICASGCSTTPVWKTILVGGLNNGGRGYYALDITDPTAPKALWEFTHANLGNTYGNPIITKLTDGTWIVAFASGYNNVSPGDGQGYLFILNANTGVLIRAIPTGAGDTTTPSGLSRITAWANFPDNNNTAQRIYGGDLLGNLWRFDINSIIPSPPVSPAPPVYDAQRLAVFKDATGAVQPITSKPELGKVQNYPVVYVGTGQLLGSDDLATTQTQSLYAVKDRLTDTDYGSPRPLTPPQTSPVPGDFVRQTLTASTCGTGKTFCTAGELIVTSTNNPVDFVTQDGWYTDFPVAGERVNTDLRLTLGTLSVNTNTPKSGACVPVGVSYAYYFDYRTGGSIEGTDGMVGVKLGDFLSTAPTPVRMDNGDIKALIRTDKPGTEFKPMPITPTPVPTRRISWRELITE